MEKRIMDDVTRRKLAGLLPFNPGSHARETPDLFNKVEESLRPVFYLRPFSKEDRQAMGEKSAEQNKFDRYLVSEGLKNSGIKGWENLLDLGTGEAVAYSKEAVDLLPDHLIWWAYHRCIELSGLGELEKEALGSSPQPTSAP